MQRLFDRQNVIGLSIGAGAVLLIALAIGIGYAIGRGGDDTATPTTTAAPTTVPATTTQATTTSTSTTTTLPRGFPELFEELRGAVANVDVAGCDFGSQGTAFLVDDDIAYTAWHVVEGATQIVLDIDGTSISAQTIGRDVDRDVAVLQLDEPVSDSPTLAVSGVTPRVGEEVAAMGHPRGLPLALTVGRVTSMNGSFDFGEVDEDTIDALIQTDAEVAPGSSGGPLINDSGEVIGVVVLRDLGVDFMYATDMQSVIGDLEAWQASPEPLPATTCLGNVDINNIDISTIASDFGHPEVPSLRRTYALYVQSINSGRAIDAYRLLGPSLTTGGDAEAWAAGQSTSWLWDWRIREVIDVDADTLDVVVTFESTQDPEFGPEPGQTCSKWSLTHRLVRGEVEGLDFWLIDGSTRTDGFPIDCQDWVAPLGTSYVLDLAEPGDEQLLLAELLAGTFDAWTVTLDAGETLVTRLDSEAFDTLLVVRDPGGVEVANNDDRGDGSLNSEIVLDVAETGVYTIEVHHLTDSFGGEYVIEAALAVG